MIYTRRFDEGCQDSFRTVEEERKREEDDEIQFILTNTFDNAYLFHCNDFCFSLKGEGVRKREGREGGRRERKKERTKV
jgi:hypothetical protein